MRTLMLLSVVLLASNLRADEPAFPKFKMQEIATDLTVGYAVIVADIVNIPFDTMQQVCLTPLAFTKGTDFKPAVRPNPDTVIDWR